ncbi:MAG TPA: anthranilate synthase component I [Negativicutes bacterium]|nr:anthranilate synthase component I [Negativicutes bacterium]
MMKNLSQLPFRSMVEDMMTAGQIRLERTIHKTDVSGATDTILEKINTCKGALFSSSYEFPNRYSRWDTGFVNPCLEIRGFGRNFTIKALNKRGEVLLPALAAKLRALPELQTMEDNGAFLMGTIKISDEVFPEEQRSKQPTIFSLIRAVKELFYLPDDNFLGLYGAFGYDLVFQFEPMPLKHERAADQPDLVLYLPDDLIVVDHQASAAYRITYEFTVAGTTTAGLPRDGEPVGYGQYTGRPEDLPALTHGKYAAAVRKALTSFKRGDLFEVVASHTIVEPCNLPPAEVFVRMKEINPSPYGFIINMGREFLVGASPEMFVRVEGARVETCPISGTIKRGKDAIEDARQIKKLLNSHKDEAELTMCTDVDRNDKSRVCIPGSVRVIGRRQIEMYSHLIHTVDHVEGLLRPEYDSLDAFLTHMWAVTVTGAPKRAAIKWLEREEDSARKWYGGAVGFLKFNGDLNTGLTLRTVNLRAGVAEVRVGATLLYDSVPEEEENETYVKAAAMLKSINEKVPAVSKTGKGSKKGKDKKILFVDHEDSFVHTLANYFRQTGAEVVVMRAPLARRMLAKGEKYDLVVLSPGPGRPEEFALNETIDLCIAGKLPLFGVCLGLQGIVEYFGGLLGELDYPQHGKSSLVKVCAPGSVWENLPPQFYVGRYHSLYARHVPACLEVAATAEDGVVMAVRHKEMPIFAVQFHPESIMTLQDNTGLKLISNVIACFA